MRNLLFGLLITYTLLPLSLQANDCGIDWEVISPKVETGYQRAVIYANDQFLSVGDGRVLLSADGINWTSHPIQADLSDVIWLNNRYLGVGRHGIWSSTDGIKWTPVAEEVRTFKLAANGQTVVALGTGRNGNLWHSTDGGHTWTQQSLGEYIYLTSILTDGEKFVLSSNDLSSAQGIKTAFWMSTDGTSWEKIPLNTFKDLDFLVFDGTRYLALASHETESGQFMLRSDNLVDWEILQRRTLSTESLKSLMWVDGHYIAALADDSRVEISTDAENWSSHPVATGGALYRHAEVATNGQTHVAAANSLDLLSSNTLIDWFSVAYIGADLIDVVANSQRFVAVNSSRNSELLMSTDGYHWVTQMIEKDRLLYGVEWFKNRFFAWGYNETRNIPILYSSQNGIAWTAEAVNNGEFSRLFANSATEVVAGPDHLIMFTPRYSYSNFAVSSDGLNWQSVTLSTPDQENIELSNGIWDGQQFVFIAFKQSNQTPQEPETVVATSVDGQQWQFREINSVAQLSSGFYSSRPSIAYNGNTYVLATFHEKTSYSGIDPVIYTSTDLNNWTLQQPKIAPYAHTSNRTTYVYYTDLYWTGHEFLLTGDINLRSKDGVSWQPVVAPNMRAVAGNDNALVGVRDHTLVVSQCQSDPQRLSVMGSAITETVHIRALINVANQYQNFPYIEARWRQGGQATTARGDQVIWGYFYADPQEIDWGSPDNPELFVKIWFDVSGRIDVNYFHVSVPNIDVYTSFNGDLNEPDQFSRTTVTDRYIRHFLRPDGSSDHDIRQEDGVSAEMPTVPASNPNMYRILETFRAEEPLNIGTQIQTETAGTLDGRWFSGGEAETSRGDLVAWGYFYADPQAVDWGDQNNPEVFVKVWFDISGRIDVNYFHVSVPHINLFSDYTQHGHTEQRYGLTHTEDRYTRHGF